MEICDKCLKPITDKWNGFVVMENGKIICNECLEIEK
jgi:formylmethanofuran dehydrogenase subunit E